MNRFLSAFYTSTLVKWYMLRFHCVLSSKFSSVGSSVAPDETVLKKDGATDIAAKAETAANIATSDTAAFVADEASKILESIPIPKLKEAITMVCSLYLANLEVTARMESLQNTIQQVIR